jgi:hypothetical protein
MLLYLLLEVELGITQLLCKTPLKTNPEVHYHGVDGVYGKVIDTAVGLMALLKMPSIPARTRGVRRVVHHGRDPED